MVLQLQGTRLLLSALLFLRHVIYIQVASLTKMVAWVPATTSTIQEGGWLNNKIPFLSICLSSFNGAFLEILLNAAAAAKSSQSCPTLCDPLDCSPPGSAVPRILQARTLEWVAISFSNAWKWKVKVKWLSCVWPLATPWTAAYQAPPPMRVSRQEYQSGVKTSDV